MLDFINFVINQAQGTKRLYIFIFNLPNLGVVGLKKEEIKT